MRGWDYAGPGWYFVTLCTGGGECSFGDVVDGELHLSPIGEIAGLHWEEIASHLPNASVDAFVVMPNHIDGVVIIEKP